MNPTSTNARGENSHSYPAYDYPVGIGTGLVAPKAGTITDLPGVPTRALMSPLQNWQAWPSAGGGSPNSGNVMMIDHGNGEYTAYLHVTPYDVNAFRGRRVSQGQTFHVSGHNGWSTGPHLHFEVWKNGARIDPGPWLASIKQGVQEMSDITRGHENHLSLLATGFYPGDGYNFRHVKKGAATNDWDAMFQFWDQVSKEVGLRSPNASNINQAKVVDWILNNTNK